jgi:hypothetical protein
MTMTQERKRNTRKTRGTNRASSTASKAKKQARFDGGSSDDWHSIPSKGMLFKLAIAGFNGAKIPGSAISNRAKAKEVIAQATEDGFLDS